jgi:hypothetical protein
MKSWKPIFIENSKVPVWLSKFAPIEINAIALFPFVFSRSVTTETTRRHETIHFQQQLETFVLFFYAIYLWDYLKAKVKGVSGALAYRSIRAEREAYDNQSDEGYLATRRRFRWLKQQEI